jgi:hypothetical protein
VAFNSLRSGPWQYAEKRTPVFPVPCAVNKIDLTARFCSFEHVRANQLEETLAKLSEAIHETESVLKAMRAEHDPLAVHIFVSRRQYRNTPDTKGGKRSDLVARTTWQTACDLGFRGSLGEWERLIGAAPRR